MENVRCPELLHIHDEATSDCQGRGLHQVFRPEHRQETMGSSYLSHTSSISLASVCPLLAQRTSGDDDMKPSLNTNRHLPCSSRHRDGVLHSRVLTIRHSGGKHVRARLVHGREAPQFVPALLHGREAPQFVSALLCLDVGMRLSLGPASSALTWGFRL